MSDVLVAALQKEEDKLKRQIANHDATKALMEVVGETAKELNKLSRQADAMKETKSNIAKLKKAIG